MLSGKRNRSRRLTSLGYISGGAAAVDPRSADALSGLASVAFSTKDYGQAEGLLQTALTVEPGNEELRLHLALVKRAMGDSAAARAIYTTLTRSRKPDVANRAAQELRQLR